MIPESTFASIFIFYLLVCVCLAELLHHIHCSNPSTWQDCHKNKQHEMSLVLFFFFSRSELKQFFFFFLWNNKRSKPFVWLDNIWVRFVNVVNVLLGSQFFSCYLNPWILNSASVRCISMTAVVYTRRWTFLHQHVIRSEMQALWCIYWLMM